MSMVRRFPGPTATFDSRRGRHAKCRAFRASFHTTAGAANGNVWQEGERQGREGDAREEARHAEERRLGQEGDEPQAGHRDRPVRSEEGRRQGAGEEVRREEVDRQEVHWREEVDREEEDGEEVGVELTPAGAGPSQGGMPGDNAGMPNPSARFIAAAALALAAGASLAQV